MCASVCERVCVSQCVECVCVSPGMYERPIVMMSSDLEKRSPREAGGVAVAK